MDVASAAETGVFFLFAAIMAMAISSPRTKSAKPHSVSKESAKPAVVGVVVAGLAHTLSSLSTATRMKPSASNPRRVNNDVNFIQSPPREFDDGSA